MKSVKYVVTLYILHFKQTSFFRFSFLMKLLSRMSHVLFYWVLFEIIYRNVHSIGSWSKAQVFMLLGTMGIVLNLSGSLMKNGAGGISGRVRYGYMDILFSRPLPGPVLLTFSTPDIVQLFSLILPTYLFIHGCRLSSIPCIINLVFWGIGVLLSIIIYILFNLLIGMVALKTVQFSSAFWVLEDLYQMGRFPADIFPIIFRYIFLTIIPVLTISNLPVLVLIKGPVYLLPLMGITVFFVCLNGILYPVLRKSYQGVGTVR